MKKRLWPFLLTIIILYIVCAKSLRALASDNPNVFYCYDVQYMSQNQQYWCGPACLEIVSNYWKINVTQQDIAEAIYDPQANVTRISEMESYAQGLGFKTINFTGSIDLLKEWIFGGIPVITLQKFSFQDPYGHYRVVIGYNDLKSEITTLDPILGGNYNFSYADFTQLWNTSQTFSEYAWCLVITSQNVQAVDLIQEYQILKNTALPQVQASENVDIPGSVWAVIVTVLIGITVCSIGQVTSKFLIEPIHEQDKIRGEIANVLIFYANIYANPMNTLTNRNAADRIRELCSMLSAKS